MIRNPTSIEACHFISCTSKQRRHPDIVNKYIQHLYHTEHTAHSTQYVYTVLTRHQSKQAAKLAKRSDNISDHTDYDNPDIDTRLTNIATKINVRNVKIN